MQLKCIYCVRSITDAIDPFLEFIGETSLRVQTTLVFFGGFFLPPELVVGLPPSVECPPRIGLVCVSLVRLTGVLPSLPHSNDPVGDRRG